ncbi:MAG TPA: Na+/H+ antiporter NhaA [Bacteroidia bacterium]|nr:Na+/H+ antiporter NhaA [Bacteroidia bacterium]HRD40330.1 Na+/H+ antiporter NhaA [Bacteroidia bacterium]
MRLSKLFNDFFESEKAGGLILIICTAVSLLIANSSYQLSYHHFWETNISGYSLEYWINDGLMAIFFLLIGLELEREVYKGELSNFKNALLPIVAALGGMLVPAFIHYLLNAGTPTQGGAGIPMATDIAFAIGILSLLGNKVPPALKIFLTALAVIDDLGAIFTIAIFYTSQMDWMNLLLAMLIFVGLLIMNRLKLRNVFFYLVPGFLMWYFMSKSGVHPTISGVLLAFAIPFGNGDEKSTSYLLQHALHKPVAFFILPLFAMANTAIVINSDSVSQLGSANSLGIILGLVLGKTIGISMFTFISTKIGITRLSEGINFKQIIGAGFLGGIGFTMSVFITLLAFSDLNIINVSKLSILIASLTSALFGLILLRFTLK